MSADAVWKSANKHIRGLQKLILAEHYKSLFISWFLEKYWQLESHQVSSQIKSQVFNGQVQVESPVVCFLSKQTLYGSINSVWFHFTCKITKRWNHLLLFLLFKIKIDLFFDCFLSLVTFVVDAETHSAKTHSGKEKTSAERSRILVQSSREQAPSYLDEFFNVSNIKNVKAKYMHVHILYKIKQWREICSF